MNEKIDGGGKKWMPCWDCGELINPDEAKSIPITIEYDPSGDAEDKAAWYPCCDNCWQVWRWLLEEAE